MYVLFLTEMWERFSYYGLRALLIFYLTQHFLFVDSDAFIIYGSFAALVFIFPILGGYIADHYLGYRKSIVLGGILMICGHAGMTFEGVPASVSNVAEGVQSVQRAEIAVQVLYLSLSLLIVGVGFLKPNITTLLGRLYPVSGHQREVGFIAFYMGITAGASLSAFLCGYLGIVYGWKYGFGAAGIGMCIGLAVFLYGQRYLHGIGDPPSPKLLRQSSPIRGFSVEQLIYLIAAFAVLGVWVLIQLGQLSGYLVLTLFVVGICGIGFYARTALGTIERNDVFTVLLVALISALFSIYVTQGGITINLFTARHVDLVVLGMEFKAPQMQGLSGVFVILTGPFIMWVTAYLGNRKVDVPMFLKLGIGVMIVGLGFLILTYGTINADQMSRVQLLFLVVMFLCWAVGDNLLLPTSFSAVAKLSPKSLSGLMMGLYMMAFSVGYFGAAYVAQWAAVDSTNVIEAASSSTLLLYRNFFATLGISGVAFGAMICTFPWLGSTKWLAAVKRS